MTAQKLSRANMGQDSSSTGLTVRGAELLKGSLAVGVLASSLYSAHTVQSFNGVQSCWARARRASTRRARVSPTAGDRVSAFNPFAELCFVTLLISNAALASIYVPPTTKSKMPE